ncbi:MAG: ATP phosphoribosyltransferase [Deltaproteobacteria bacterium]|nr:ATP phosphoribosyltransferase [Deltaproteobacteria bacterium]
MSLTPEDSLRLALPKGRMQQGVVALLEEAGIGVRLSDRGYRPRVNLLDTATKILKPQNIIEMLHVGSRDVGFAGADWVQELGAELVLLCDTELDPVQIVAAAPKALVEDGKLPKRRIVVASEYERLTRRWIASEGLDATFLRSYGATEVFPPEDADCIVDNTATGSTLRENGLVIVSELMRSSTRLFANPRALEVPHKREAIEGLVLVVRSVLEARKRVMIEVNVSAEALASVIETLPCMRMPTISPLSGGEAFAVKAAVPRDRLPTLIPALKARGGTDIVVSKLTQIVA